MFAGSHIYQPSMTIAEVAEHYDATGPMTWAKNVAALLGVSVSTRLEEIASAIANSRAAVSGG
ncbi:MAG TPA: hypothetical protein VGK48_15075 [Terriglobia bacterium]|jgi:hypothetical protein